VTCVRSFSWIMLPRCIPYQHSCSVWWCWDRLSIFIRTGAGQKPGTMLEIVTLNIEGTKGNSPYLKHLCDENRILCLQEHWLHGYVINTIQGILSGFDFQDHLMFVC
jgi:hypothetical protein